ncbi:MAG: nucleotidyltransferase domain-containing protein [Bdellovibrionota bacterium]
MSTLDTKKILEIAQKFLTNLQAVYLFGSYAFGLEQNDSDVDLAFLGEQKYPSKTMYSLCTELSLQLNKDFDCIDLKSTNNVFVVHIIDTGKIILNNDKYSVSNFEIRLFSQYARLNEERKDIVLDVIKRGSIYG